MSLVSRIKKWFERDIVDELPEECREEARKLRKKKGEKVLKDTIRLLKGIEHPEFLCEGLKLTQKHKTLPYEPGIVKYLPQYEKKINEKLSALPKNTRSAVSTHILSEGRAGAIGRSVDTVWFNMTDIEKVSKEYGELTCLGLNFAFRELRKGEAGHIKRLLMLKKETLNTYNKPQIEEIIDITLAEHQTDAINAREFNTASQIIKECSDEAKRVIVEYYRNNGTVTREAAEVLKEIDGTELFEAAQKVGMLPHKKVLDIPEMTRIWKKYEGQRPALTYMVVIFQQGTRIEKKIDEYHERLLHFKDEIRIEPMKLYPMSYFERERRTPWATWEMILESTEGVQERYELARAYRSMEDISKVILMPEEQRIALHNYLKAGIKGDRAFAMAERGIKKIFTQGVAERVAQVYDLVKQFEAQESFLKTIERIDKEHDQIRYLSRLEQEIKRKIDYLERTAV